jgi:hypothetical protein
MASRLSSLATVQDVEDRRRREVGVARTSPPTARWREQWTRQVGRLTYMDTQMNKCFIIKNKKQKKLFHLSELKGDSDHQMLSNRQSCRLN